MHHGAGSAGNDPVSKPNLTDRMAGNLRKAMGIGAKELETVKRIQPESEVSHAAVQSAAMLVQIGLAAFAVSAYVRSTLCPALQHYCPQPIHPKTMVSTGTQAWQLRLARHCVRCVTVHAQYRLYAKSCPVYYLQCFEAE